MVFPVFQPPTDQPVSMNEFSTESRRPKAPRSSDRGPRDRNAHRPKRRDTRRDVHGWLIFDKPVGMTSTHAVALAKRAFNAKKAGHAGTLDPLASGCLPIALGEATKTVPYVMEGRKAYRFTVTWGAETTTDDTEGTFTQTSDQRPTHAQVEALLPRFTGVILQVPPNFSAIKIGGERAYDLAREGETVTLEPREVIIDTLDLMHHDGATSVLEATCGKGTYVRAIARDLGRLLGCYGHVTALRRTRVGPFVELDFVRMEDLAPALQNLSGPAPDAVAEVQTGVAAQPEPGILAEVSAPAPPAFDVRLLDDLLAPVEQGLCDLESLTVSREQANRLRRGQSILLRGHGIPPAEGPLAVHSEGELVAIGLFEKGEVHPHRVFQL